MKPKTDRTPLDGIDLILADLDGVVYRGKQAIPHAVESLNRAQDSLRIGYLTNNASRTPESVSEQLNSLGLKTKASDILTSPQAAMRSLRELVSPGAVVLVVGGDGLRRELEQSGYRITESAEDAPQAVVQGFAADVSWKQLAEASFALHNPDVPWIATNNDWTLPTERGMAPGNGTLVSAVHLATGRMPIVAGKPERALFDFARERFDSKNPLMIGDRLDTDILGANRAGVKSLLVLTGADQAKQVLAADPDSRPAFVIEDLRGLHEEYPQPRVEIDADGKRTVTVRDSAVTMTENEVSAPVPGSSRIDLLRAGAQAIWSSGLAIYGLKVDPAIYA